MFKTTLKNDLIIVSFPEMDRINTLISENVKKELKSRITSPGKTMIIDLEGIDFVDSSGFGAFLSIMKHAGENQCKLIIANISDKVMELFKLLQLHNIFELYRDLEDAVESAR